MGKGGEKRRGSHITFLWVVMLKRKRRKKRTTGVNNVRGRGVTLPIFPEKRGDSIWKTLERKEKKWKARFVSRVEILTGRRILSGETIWVEGKREALYWGGRGKEEDVAKREGGEEGEATFRSQETLCHFYSSLKESRGGQKKDQ